MLHPGKQFFSVAAGIVAAVITVQLYSAPRGGQSRQTSASAAPQEDATPEAALPQIGAAWRAKDFAKARALTGRLPEESARDRILRLIQFGEACSALERNGIESASRLARDLPAGLKRALLFIGIASRQVAAGERLSAAASLESALQDAAAIPVEQRVQLLAMAGAVLSTFDAARGRAVLDEAVRQYQSALQSDPPAAAFRFTGYNGRAYFEVVSVGAARPQVFPLRVPGVPAVDLSRLVSANAYHDGSFAPAPPPRVPESRPPGGKAS